MRLIVRWIIVAIAVAVATRLIPGIHVQGTSGWIAVVIMAAVLGLANAIIRPILAFLSCGCIVATLGLFMLVINALTFWLAAWISTNWLDTGIVVDNFLSALLGSVVVSIVSFLLSVFLPDE